MNHIPLSLYIHFPWCIKKCPYCDFNSHTLKTDLPEEQYILALIHDFKRQLIRVDKRAIQSIFMGGGTPSLFSPAAIKLLLEQLSYLVDFDNKIEITLEANPGTIDNTRFEGYFAAGVNRLSIGVQSFNNEHLQSLGRIHSGEKAIAAIESAQKAGFKNFNIDLMHTLPKQTVQDALNDITTAIAFKPTHISWYQLTLEPNTLFYRSPPNLPTESVAIEIFETGEALLTEKGYSRYEISAFSNLECLHNLNYWQFGDYIGIGAGAHGKSSTVNRDGHISITRTVNYKHPKTYIENCMAPNNSAIEMKRVVSENELPFEFMMNVLRLINGVPIQLLTERTGLSVSSIENTLKKAQGLGLLEPVSHKLKTTIFGQRFLNDLLSMFLPSV